MRIAQTGGKCGCPDCKGEPIPYTRSQWKARRNQCGLGFGASNKPRKRHARRHSTKDLS